MNTLLLYIPLLALTDGVTDGGTNTAVCLAGARSLLRPEKKVLVVCLAGAQLLLRPEKKV